MRRAGTRLGVARDSMGHAGSTGSITLDVYSKTWWDERVDAVTRVVEAVFTEPEVKKTIAIPPMGLPRGGNSVEMGTLRGTPGCQTRSNFSASY